MNKLTNNRFQVLLFKRLLRFSAWLQQLPSRLTPPPFRLLQIGSLFWQSRALYVAVRLGLADEIGDQEKTVREISTELNADEDHLYRLMRMLGSLGIFEEVSPKVFRNSRISAYLREDNPDNVCAMILMHNSTEMTKPWIDSLEACIRSGEVPFVESHGDDLFGYMDKHKDFDLLFSRAMDSVDNITGDYFLRDFNWSGFDRIIDVGGSKGKKAISILKSNPHLTAVVFDRPQIIGAAKHYWNGDIDRHILDRISFESGDMFESIPVAVSDQDLYLFFAIFHGLNDEEGKRVLACLKQAMGVKRPWLLIGDAVADDCKIDASIASFDMQMLIGTKGRERTLSEWRSLLADGGFTIEEVVDLRTFIKFIVARPSP